MKKTLPLAIATLGLLTFGSLTSCQDEDFDVSTAVLQERAFEQSFIKEFGKPSANQGWDFYAQKMESLRQEAGLTRGTQAITVEVDKTISQPTDTFFTGLVSRIGYALEESHDNSTVGQNNYSLTSTGDFKIYAVRYAGAIETQSRYALDFGIAYYEDGERKLVPIFGYGFKTGYSPTSGSYGNPGWAAEVKIPKGQSFHFYLKYTYPFAAGGGYQAHNQDEIFFSDESPTFIQRNGTPLTYNDYDGPSVLLYSTEYVDTIAHVDEQIMMIGFEDAWGHGTGNGTQSNWFDKDFNDVVFLIEGKLPLPTAKRFFCEDKKSLDWDYNDVVFDVSNTGIVLRAVGGDLPVFLRVTNRLGVTTTYGELHELMRELQFNNKNKQKQLTYRRKDDDGVEKTFYKSIDVNAYEILGKADYGVWLDPVQIVKWTSLGTSTENTRLESGEVELFANPMVTNPVGNVELIVLPEHQTSYDLSAISQLSALTSLNEDDTKKGPKIIQMTSPGGIPAIWSGLVSAMWTKELQKITLGYKHFYGGTSVEGTSYQWYERDINTNNLYDYLGDEP